MDNLLISAFAAHLSKLKPDIPLPPLSVRKESVNEECFDIQDKKATIKQPIATGSATYKNPCKKMLIFIDYEHFMNQMPVHAEKKKRCDFIVYEAKASLFILHELSQSKYAKNKRRDARRQLLETAELLRQVPATSDFINTFAKKVCIFSNRPKQTPEGMADAFFSFPEECFSEHWPPLSKFGFSFKETDIVQIN